MKPYPLALAISLALSSTGVAFAQVDRAAPGVGVELPTPAQLEQASAAGAEALDQLLSQVLQAGPSAGQAQIVDRILQNLVRANPALAARAAVRIAAQANTLAAIQPLVALQLAQSASQALSEPRVLAVADPAVTGNAVVSLASTTAQASAAAGSAGAAIAEQVMGQIDGLAANDALVAATPDLGDQVLLAQINPGDFATAAGGDEEPLAPVDDFVTAAGGDEDPLDALDAIGGDVADELAATDDILEQAETPLDTVTPASPATL
ncbi:hypothetical protein [Marichromatium bheemlicum]|uniref:Uncharacterized protein n=1 Tax=Marichromatium bheemlicum TaxID=365339 RepID=A0ABX1IBA3_9GAMM|nr:hypothetical protein [Marichromatium bheemlicum]NKN34548.1 hypothetical protein [Marichromatium bheemlicum]